MKLSNACIIIGCAIFLFACTSEQENTKDLTETWGKDFTIKLYTGGGMSNESSKVDYTHDSCMHIEQKNEIINRKAFALTETDRITILKKLKELNFEDIKEDKQQKDIIYDKETAQICINKTDEFCVSENTIAKEDKKGLERFSEAYQFLSNFSGSK